MSLFSELVDIYNDNVSQIGKENDNTSPALLPISHTKVKILFQINLDKNGNFLGAEVIDNTRSSVNCPYHSSIGCTNKWNVSDASG